MISKLRLSSHQLLIETGRHKNVERKNRKRTLCNLNEIEDEFHFILVCPFYKEIREMYLKKYYCKKPSMYKLIELLNSSSVKILNGIGIFYKKANEKRKRALSNIND